MDAARVATRLGAAEVHVIYRRTRDDMPAEDEEIRDAHEEGVLIPPAHGAERGPAHRWKRVGHPLLSHGLSEFDRSGRRRPVEIRDSDFVIDVDIVIPAVGQA